MMKQEDVNDPNSEEENESLNDGDENQDQENEDEGRADPFAALELPPPVGSDDDLRDDWEGEDFSEEDQPPPHTDPNKDHSALAAAGQGAALNTKTAANVNMMMDELNMFGNMGGHGGDADLDAFNDPNIEHLDDPPYLGGQPQSTDLFGKTAASPMGRATSPRLYAQASQFPTCTQLRCWKWENGVPVGLGVIDAMATEEDFVQAFFAAMPKKGESKCRFKLRPIDINGQEMGKEINMLISEHHAALQQKRLQQEEENRQSGMPLFGQQPEDPTATMASEMSRMMEGMMRTTDRRTHILEESLEAERERMRVLDEERAQERIDMAMSAAQGVQALTERMMNDESARAQRAMSMQSEQSNILINTLTSVFGNQHQMMQQFAQQQQIMDNRRLEREQQRAEQERQDMELRRQRDQLEFEQRRQVERDELGEKRKEVDDQRRWEREQQELRRKEEERKWERQLEEMRLRVEKERGELERRLQRDREEMLLKLKMDQAESERKMQYERERMERDEKRRAEDRDRQMQLDREHQERMARFATLEKESQREASERRERLEREAREATEKERERRHTMLMKEMELSKERDREHAERMLSMSKAEMASKGFGGLTEMVPKAAGLLREFGLEPADVVGRIMGGGDEAPASGGGWMENLPKLLGVASEVIKAGLAAKDGVMPQIPMMGTPAALPPPGMEMYDPSMFEQPQAQPLRARRRKVPSQEEQMEAIRRQQEEIMRQAAVQESNEVPAVKPPSEAKAEVQSDPTADLTNAQKAKVAGMKLREQRNARNGIRKLIKKLGSTDQDEWEGQIMMAIAEEVSIFHYIEAVSVVSAMEEGGAESSMIATIVEALKKSDMVPNDFNFGEAKGGE